MNDKQYTSARIEFLGRSVIITPEHGFLHTEYTSMVTYLIVVAVSLFGLNAFAADTPTLAPDEPGNMQNIFITECKRCLGRFIVVHEPRD